MVPPTPKIMVKEVIGKKKKEKRKNYAGSESHFHMK
jgi:hypothetical protein